MTDWKPELDWLDNPEIHRQEILDLTPPQSHRREAFTNAIVERICRSQIRPDNVDVLKTRQKGNSLLKKIRRKLEILREANIEAGQAIREWIEATTERKDVGKSFSPYSDNAVQIDSIISRVELDLDFRTRGIPEDARIKEVEARLVETTLATWKAYFPEHRLPAKAMQGRADGHELCRPALLCRLVLEFATGIEQTDVTRLYERAIQRMNNIDQSPGTITLPL